MPEMRRTSSTAVTVICTLALSMFVGWLPKAWKLQPDCRSWVYHSITLCLHSPAPCMGQ